MLRSTHVLAIGTVGTSPGNWVILSGTFHGPQVCMPLKPRVHIMTETAWHGDTAHAEGMSAR